MKNIIKNLVSSMMYLIPRDLRYEICRHHANKELAENRSDFRTNGELWLSKRVLPHMNTAFDVGAHTGEWALEALRINSRINLHCFEPSQRSFLTLQDKGFPENVICNNVGLGSKNGGTILYGSEGSGEANSLYLRSGLENIEGFKPQNRVEQIQIRTLDSYCKEKNIREIDFLKIDVEGHELAVIEGGRETFERHGVKMVLFEYGGCYIDSRTLLRDFYEFFDGMNHSFFLLYPRRLRPVPKYEQRLENFQYKNFVIVNTKDMQVHRFLKELVSPIDDYE